MVSRKLIQRAALCAVAALTLSLIGCSVSTGGYVSNSQFVFPNSNVEALGNIRGKVSKFRPIFPPSIGVKNAQKAHMKAIQSCSGADIMINYQYSTANTIWIPFLLYSCSYKVEGQGAKMEIGEQMLR